MKKIYKIFVLIMCAVIFALNMNISAQKTTQLVLSGTSKNLDPADVTAVNLQLENVSETGGISDFDFALVYDIDVLEFAGLVFSDKKTEKSTSYIDFGGRIAIEFSDGGETANVLTEDKIYAKAVFRVRSKLIGAGKKTKLYIEKGKMGNTQAKPVEYVVNELELPLSDINIKFTPPENNQKMPVDTLSQKEIVEISALENIQPEGFNLDFKPEQLHYSIKVPYNYNTFIINAKTKSEDTYVELKQNNDVISVFVKEKNKLPGIYNIKIQYSSNLSEEFVSRRTEEMRLKGFIPLESFGKINQNDYNIKKGNLFQGGIKTRVFVSQQQIQKALEESGSQKLEISVSGNIIIIISVCASVIIFAGIILCVILMRRRGISNKKSGLS